MPLSPEEGKSKNIISRRKEKEEKEKEKEEHLTWKLSRGPSTWTHSAGHQSGRQQ
jgi:spore coat polysaccharide biosynthesis protein SpsF (cytidylyltransferase family)